jgi:hypothetical protein
LLHYRIVQQRKLGEVLQAAKASGQLDKNRNLKKVPKSSPTTSVKIHSKMLASAKACRVVRSRLPRFDTLRLSFRDDPRMAGIIRTLPSNRHR